MNNLLTYIDPVLRLDSIALPDRSVAVNIIVHVTVPDHAEFVIHMPANEAILPYPYHNYYLLPGWVNLDAIFRDFVGDLGGIITLTLLFAFNTSRFSEPQVVRACDWRCVFNNSVVAGVGGMVFGIVLGQADIIILTIIFIVNTRRRVPQTAHRCSWGRFFASCIVGAVIGIVLGLVVY